MHGDLLRNAARQLEVCNACRYCEGYCAVFPALERRTEYDEDAVKYLANLCHDCRDCYYACPYAPPHEFAIDLPKVLSEVRIATYQEATPVSALRAAGRKVRHDLALSLAGTIVALAVAILVSGSAVFSPQLGPGAFYRVVPWLLMVVPGMLLGIWVSLALAIGAVRFYRAIATGPGNGSIRGHWSRPAGRRLPCAIWVAEVTAVATPRRASRARGCICTPSSSVASL